MAGPGVKRAPILVNPGNNEGNFGQEPPLDALIMDNLETSLETTVDKARGTSNEAIVERFIKHRASTIFVHLTYSLDGPGPPNAVSVTHENF